MLVTEYKVSFTNKNRIDNWGNW